MTTRTGFDGIWRVQDAPFTSPSPPMHTQPPPPSGMTRGSGGGHGITQAGGGDRDADNRGGPNDGDGAV